MLAGWCLADGSRLHEAVSHICRGGWRSGPPHGEAVAPVGAKKRNGAAETD